MASAPLSLKRWALQVPELEKARAQVALGQHSGQA